jgi:hypothetical protein
VHICSMKKFVWLAGLAVVFLACNDERKKVTDTLDKEVMALHDEVMPEMGKVLTCRKRINQLIDSCANAACKDSLQKVSYMLTKADEDMMQWMRNFEHPEGLDTAEAYLLSQKQEMEKVKIEVTEALAKAKTILAE